MIKLIRIVVLIVCANTVVAQTMSTAQKLAKAGTLTLDSLIQSCVDHTNLDSLIQTVDVLSGEDSVTINDSTYLILSRYAEHPHNDLAAEYIYQRLTRLGLPTYNQRYDSLGRNVYAVKSGTDHPNTKVIICAHYDAFPWNGPGADDNASGVAAVLESARILSQIPTPYTLIFACWDEEEDGMTGSKYFAEQAAQSGEDILGVVNLEMSGWDGDGDSLFHIHTRPIGTSIQLSDLVQELASVYSPSISSVVFNPGTTSSDHSSFWNQGYSAVVFSEATYGGPRANPYFHTSDDRIIHFTLEFFHALSKLAVATAAYLSLHGLPSDAVQDQITSVYQFKLGQNYPNPFNATTVVSYQLPEVSDVKLTVYDILGREISVLVNGRMDAGKHSVTFDASRLSSGVYIYQLQAGKFVESRRLVFLK